MKCNFACTLCWRSLKKKTAFVWCIGRIIKVLRNNRNQLFNVLISDINKTPIYCMESYLWEKIKLHNITIKEPQVEKTIQPSWITDFGWCLCLLINHMTIWISWFISLSLLSFELLSWITLRSMISIPSHFQQVKLLPALWISKFKCKCSP